MTWRKIHFGVSMIIGLQMVFWIVSGMGFSVLWDRATGGERQIRNIEPPSLSVREVRMTVGQVHAVVQSRFPGPVAVRSMSMQSHGLDGRPIYVVRLDGMDTPAVIDAGTGEWMEFLTAEEATTIALRDFTGAAPVRDVEWIGRPYQKGYDYHGELPVYRVNFDNWRATRIYVSANTGDIRLRRNVDKTVFDVFWTLHMFGYVDRDIQGNAALIVTGVISLIATLSGLALYLPYLNRKRVNGRSPA